MKRLLLFSCFITIALVSCKKEDMGSSSQNNGVSGYHSSTLGGSKWVMYQYKDASLQAPITRSDTLVFSDSTHFTWNNVPCTYHLYIQPSITQLIMNGTPFGNIGGTPANNFVAYGEIIDIPFTESYSGYVYNLWFRKIP